VVKSFNSCIEDRASLYEHIKLDFGPLTDDAKSFKTLPDGKSQILDNARVSRRSGKKIDGNVLRQA
jgi:hypothetical protein